MSKGVTTGRSLGSLLLGSRFKVAVVKSLLQYYEGNYETFFPGDVQYGKSKNNEGLTGKYSVSNVHVRSKTVLNNPSHNLPGCSICIKIVLSSL